MAEFEEYTKIMKLSRVEIGQMHEIAYLTRDAYENKRSESFIQNKVVPLLKAIGVGSSIATVMKLPVPVPVKLTLAILSLSSSFITGTDYYLNMLKQGERDLLKAKQWAEANKGTYKYFQIEVGFMEYMTTTAQGRVPVVYVQAADSIRRAQKHDGTWVNV